MLYTSAPPRTHPGRSSRGPALLPTATRTRPLQYGHPSVKNQLRHRTHAVISTEELKEDQLLRQVLVYRFRKDIESLEWRRILDSKCSPIQVFQSLIHKPGEQVPEGTITISPLSVEFVSQATNLLARVFCLESMALPESMVPFLSKQIRAYVDTRLEAFPDAVILAAVLRPKEEGDGAGDQDGLGDREGDEDEVARGDGEGEEEEEEGVAEGSGARRRRAQVIGVAEIGSRLGPRTVFWTLNPPRKSAFFANLAVEPSFRRRGVASALVAASEEVAAGFGEHSIYLHTRLKDTPALELYRAKQYRIERTDFPFLALLGQDRRHLMRKDVEPLSREEVRRRAGLIREEEEEEEES